LIPVPRLSIVTTCKGRLHHLRQSLPTFLAQPDCEVIVVDFDCPDGTAETVARDFPAARVVKLENEPHFDINRGRNAGADAATGEWLAFIDADVLIVPDFHARLAPRLKPGRFLRFFPERRGTSLFGTAVMRRADFLAVGRYDEVMQGYGADDQEMYFRLVLSGVEAMEMELDLIARVIDHDTAARIRFGRLPSMLHHQRINTAYLVVKTTLLRMLGVNGVTPEQCRTLYKLVGEVVNDANRSPEAPIHFTIDLPPDPIGIPVPAWRAQRRLVFDLTPTELLRNASDPGA
jgi:glycosyltransferase involved in cell wall biosynthesis